MKPKPNFNEWVATIDRELKAYYQKQKEESKKKFEQYYR
jgi:hypothetical protein